MKLTDSAHKWTAEQYIQVLLRLLRQTDGRDKVLKGMIHSQMVTSEVANVIQYFGKLLFIVYLSKPQFKAIHPKLAGRVSSLVGAFSTARKIIRLGHCIEPYSALHPTVVSITALPPTSMGQLVKRVSMMPRDDAIDTVNNTLSVLNDISDDIVCLAKIGVLEKETGKRFEPRSNWLWLSCITMDLYACGRDLRTLEAKCRALEYDIIATATSAAAADGTLARKKRQELTAVTEKRRMQVVSLLKLMADLGFCAYDCAEATFSDQFQAACGFTAGALALYKLWRKAL